MRLFQLSFLLFLLIIHIISHSDARSILPTSTSIPRNFNQIEIVDDGEEDEQEDSSEKPTIDPSFLELSRKAFHQLNQGQQFIKPESDEDERPLWISDQQKRKEEKAGRHLNG